MKVGVWRTKVDEIMESRGKLKETLLPCLEVIQEACGHIPQEAITYLREELDVPSVDIYGVITFYGMLTTSEQGKYVIRICDSLPCYLNKSDGVLGVIEKELGIEAGETSADRKFTLEVVPCLGLCDKAPAMMVNDRIYGNLTKQSVKKIIAELKR
jgi:NADH:ubiquinone oxidoreductase subunit E